MTNKDETFDRPPGAVNLTIPDGQSDTIDGAGTSLNLLADRYVLLSHLGEGGMGTVYRARDVELDEIIAVKMLHPRVVSNRRARLLFRREVKLARRVTHTNVARTFDLQLAGEQVFLTMEFVDGATLRHELRDGPIPADRVAELAIEICRGLAAAHSVGVIHRDLKPDNVMLDRSGRVVLTDFGIATLTGQDEAGMVGDPALYFARTDARCDGHVDLGYLLVGDHALGVADGTPSVRRG